MVVNGNIRRLAPSVRPFVEELFSSGLFSYHEVELFAPHSGLSSYEIHKRISDDNCDRFKLVLPCAGYSITWEVIFDGTCSDAAPDFIFDDESFLCDCDLDSIPSLVNWDPSDIKSFVNVISDLLILYSKHQRQEAARSINPSIEKWLDIETVQFNGLKVEVLHGSHVRIVPSTIPRQNILQNGSTSVVVKVPVSCDLVDSNNMHFTLQYIFKSHLQHYEERVECSPQLEGWLRPLTDSFKKRNRWTCECNALSAAVQLYTKEITDLFRKCVQDFKKRQEIQMSMLYHILSRTEASPSLLEFDFHDFQFSSYLLKEKKLFTVEVFRGVLRGRLFQITDDCLHRQLTEIKVHQMTDPTFDILAILSR